jgi:hypothetical protein
MVDDNLQPHLTFNLLSSGSWNKKSLTINKISPSEIEPEPGYIKRLREKLSQKRLVGRAETVKLENLTPDSVESNALLTKYFESASMDLDTSNVLQKVTQTEIFHYKHIFQQSMLQDQVDFSYSKKAHMHVVLYELSRHVRQVDNNKLTCLKL